MIKWGGRKPSSGSSSSSFISHASPFSWLSKFKHMRISSSVPNTGQNKKKPKLNSAYDASPQNSCEYGGEGFCVRDDGAFCRQSFLEGSYEDKKNKGIDESVIIQSSSCQSSTRNGKKHGRSEGTVKLKEKDIIGVGDERKLVNDRKVSRERDEYNREKEYENLRRRFERKAQRVFQEHLMTLEKQVEEVEFGSSKAVEKDVLQYESPRSTTICTPRTHSFASPAVLKNSSLRNSIVEKIEKNDKKKMSSERQNMKQSEELKVKAKRQKQQPLHVSREIQRRKPKQGSKVRIYSPRMASKVEICKIKAIEDKRKARLRMKKEKEEIVEETPGLDSFAVIKCSLDPKQDFRDSMIEMIMENQISQPGEMEELLACYLTLNAVEHHDLIIKVFRQVWFDMSQGGLGILKSNMQFCCTE